MSDENPPGFDDTDNVIAIRHPVSGAPVVIPREVALEESRAYQAYSDYLSGMGWELIAEKYEYLDARAAQYDIKQYVESARSLYNSLTIHQAKALAMARLEALLGFTWKTASAGNLPAINTAHQLIVSTIKLNKLDQADDDEDNEANQTVIVGGTEDNYVAELERASKD